MNTTPYNHFKGMLAITKASLTSIIRSPSAIVFSLLFPLIFILVFGFLGEGGGPTFKLVLDKKGDTSNIIVQALHQIPAIKWETFETDKLQESSLIKGRITGILKIEKQPQGNYLVLFRSTTASNDKISALLPILENMINKIDLMQQPNFQHIATIQTTISEVRPYRTIDFVLPGQLGFSLLSAGVFGVAFLFFNLRQQLVLKRFFATPIKRAYIVMGEALSRVIFQITNAVIIIGLGYVAFHFTLVNGLYTFLEIMVLSFFTLIVFMGFGFVVSGVAKSESAIPPISNLITLPQFLLAGTFFSIDVYPKWLQPICKVFPLTHFNEAMRKISFEGAHLTDCGHNLLILLIWGVVVYTAAIKLFKWE